MGMYQFRDKSSRIIFALTYSVLLAIVATGCSRRPPPPPPIDPGLHVLETTAAEDSGRIRFTIRLEPSRDEPVIVKYETVQISGSDATRIAVAGQDYTATRGDVIFEPGEISRVVSVPVTADAIYEYDEKLSLRIYDSNGTNIVTSRADGIILNDDSVPVASLTIDNAADLSEASHPDSRTLSVKLSAKSGLDIELKLIKNSTGSAIPNIDYVVEIAGQRLVTNETFIVPAGQTSYPLALSVIDDGNFEGTERVAIELSKPDSANADVFLSGSNSRIVTMLINDNDTGLLGIALNDSGQIAASTLNHAAEDSKSGFDVTALDDTDGVSGFQFSKYVDYNQLTAPATDVYANTPWNCVLDQRTGLLWEVKQPEVVDQANPRRADRQFYWFVENTASNGGVIGGVKVQNYEDCTLNDANQQACGTAYYEAYANQIKLCGITGWRLPGSNELRSIVNYGSTNNGTNAAIDNSWFPNTIYNPGDTVFWTRDSVFASDNKNAWAMDFITGVDVQVVKNETTAFESLSYVRLVNDSAIVDASRRKTAAETTAAGCSANLQSDTPTERFTIQSATGVNDVVVDNMTGLMWDRCPFGVAWDNVNSSCGSSPSQYTWAAALSQAAGSYLGYSDWRLPNVKELASLVEHKCGSILSGSQAINATIFPDTPSTSFWSSTYSNDPYSFALKSTDGMVVPIDRATATLAVRLVRDLP